MRKAKKEALQNYENACRTWMNDQTGSNYDKLLEAESSAIKNKLTYADLLPIDRKVKEEWEKALFEKTGRHYIA